MLRAYVSTRLPMAIAISSALGVLGLLVHDRAGSIAWANDAASAGSVVSLTWVELPSGGSP
jgi:hypothetical protein